MQNKTHVGSLLILLMLVLSAAIFFLVSTIAGVTSVIDLVQDRNDPASTMITSVAFGFEMLVILLCAWFVLQKLRGLAQAEQPLQLPFSSGYIFAVAVLVLAAVAVGGAVAYQEIPFLALIVLPPLTVIVIALPLWLLLGIGGGNLALGARWRAWGAFGLGMTFSPFVMIVFEVIALFFVILVGAIFLAMQPGLLDEALKFIELVRAETDQEVILNMLAPYLVKPGVIAAALIYIAFIVPLIEELFKPLAVFFFAKSLDTPAQGFALGLLSGAAFALLESLNASADSSTTWVVIVSVRAGTTLLHITASGLVGWGIAGMFQEKKILRFIAVYLCAAAIHGLWNACALIAGLSTVSMMLGEAQWLMRALPAALGGMFMLGFGMFVILVTANRTFKRQEQQHD